MSWDALGAIAEFVGSIAVLATLVYLSIQVRKNQEIAQAQSIDQSRSFQLTESNQLIEHAELIEKANAGEALSAVETRILNTMLNARARNAFLDYLGATRLGIEYPHFRAHQFAFFVARNPGYLDWWEKWKETSLSNDSSPLFDEWFALVNDKVNEVLNEG